MLSGKYYYIIQKFSDKMKLETEFVLPSEAIIKKMKYMELQFQNTRH